MRCRQSTLSPQHPWGVQLMPVLPLPRLVRPTPQHPGSGAVLGRTCRSLYGWSLPWSCRRPRGGLRARSRSGATAWPAPQLPRASRTGRPRTCGIRRQKAGTQSPTIPACTVQRYSQATGADRARASWQRVHAHTPRWGTCCCPALTRGIPASPRRRGCCSRARSAQARTRSAAPTGAVSGAGSMWTRKCRSPARARSPPQRRWCLAAA